MSLILYRTVPGLTSVMTILTRAVRGITPSYQYNYYNIRKCKNQYKIVKYLHYLIHIRHRHRGARAGDGDRRGFRGYIKRLGRGISFCYGV